MPWLQPCSNASPRGPPAHSRPPSPTAIGWRPKRCRGLVPCLPPSPRRCRRIGIGPGRGAFSPNGPGPVAHLHGAAVLEDLEAPKAKRPAAATTACLRRRRAFGATIHADAAAAAGALRGMRAAAIGAKRALSHLLIRAAREGRRLHTSCAGGAGIDCLPRCALSQRMPNRPIFVRGRYMSAHSSARVLQRCKNTAVATPQLPSSFLGAS